MDELQKELDSILKDEWQGLFKSMGVSSMEELMKAGKKDKSKLVPVKKQITRGGRTVETTVWVSPKEAEEQKKPKAKKEQKKSDKKEEPKTSKGKASVGIVAPHSSEVRELHKQLDSWNNSEVSQALKDASKDHYLLTAKSGGKVVGVGAFKKKGNNLHMEHFGSSRELAGVGKQLVTKLLQEASKQDIGVTLNPPKGSAKFLSSLGFKDDYSGVLSLDAEEVKKLLGDKPKEDKVKPSESASEKTKAKEKAKQNKTK